MTINIIQNKRQTKKIRSESTYFYLYLDGEEFMENKLRPVVVQIPDGIIGQAGPKQWV